MTPSPIELVTSLAAGLIVGVSAAYLWIRGQRRAASSVLARAEADAERIRGDAQREAEAARSQGIVAGKMEALKLREDLEREVARRREEWERAERRAEDRGRAL